MRKYTYTLKEERKYRVGIDAESEKEADEILEDIGVEEMKKNLMEITSFEVINVEKGDFAWGDDIKHGWISDARTQAIHTTDDIERKWQYQE